MLLWLLLLLLGLRLLLLLLLLGLVVCIVHGHDWGVWRVDEEEERTTFNAERCSTAPMPFVAFSSQVVPNRAHTASSAPPDSLHFKLQLGTLLLT